MTTTAKTQSELDPAKIRRLKANLDDPRIITFREAQAYLTKNKDAAIYVMNHSNIGGQQKQGMVVITLTDEEQALKIPKTFIPIDITASFPADTILKSPNFRQTVQRGLVKLVDSEEADLFMENEEAQRELQRILSISEKYDQDLNQEMAQITSETSPDKSQPAEKAAPVISMDRINDAKEVDGRNEAVGILWSVFQILNDPEIPNDRQLGAIRNVADKKLVDYQYIAKMSTNEKVKEFARLNIADLEKNRD